MQIPVSDSQNSLSWGDRVEVPFFRLQMSQAPGIRRFFEWASDDVLEVSSPFDSAISVRIQEKVQLQSSSKAVKCTRFLVIMTHH